MTGTPHDESVQRAAEVLLRDYASQHSADHLTWRDFADLASRVLAAAAPHWWITTDELPRGEKILGPFATRDLALKVREYVEMVRPRTFRVSSEIPEEN